MTDASAGQWTVRKLLDWTAKHFARAEVDQPRLAAELLLARAMECERIDLYTRFDDAPAPDQLAAFRRLVSRGQSGEPIAYLVGHKEFYSLRFKVTPDVLIPRPETEILVDQAIAYLSALGRRGACWDVCTGSGCVAIAVARQAPGVSVLATDISPRAIDVARQNVEMHNLAGRVRCRLADLLTVSDDCEDLKDFDVITANPPYVADGEAVGATVRYEPPVALRGGADGLDYVRPIVRDAPGILRPGGVLIMEFGYTHADAVRDLVMATGRFAEPKILRDLQGIERAVVARTKN